MLLILLINKLVELQRSAKRVRILRRSRRLRSRCIFQQLWPAEGRLPVRACPVLFPFFEPFFLAGGGADPQSIRSANAPRVEEAMGGMGFYHAGNDSSLHVAPEAYRPEA